MDTVTQIKRPRLAYAQSLFVLFVLLYVACLLYHAAFGMVDDHYFLRTACIGKRLPFVIYPEIGRFFPLDGQELSILGKFTAKPFWYYFFNAVEMLIAAWLMIRIAGNSLRSRMSAWPYALTAFVFLTPAFVNGWFRLYVPERDEFMLLALFFFCYLRFQKKPAYWLYIVGIIAAAGSLLYKETACVLVGGIGFFHLLLGYRQTRRKQKAFDASLIAVSAIWLMVYYFVIYLHRGAHLYGTDQGNSFLLALLKTIGAYILVDPLIAVAGTGLILLRLWQIVIRRQPLDLMPDCILFSGYLFFASYLLLRQHADYHMLPLYAFVPYLVVQNIPAARVGTAAKFAMAIVLVLVANQVLYGIREISFWKTVPENYQTTLSALDAQIKASPTRVNIFMAGSNRGSGGELFTSLAEFLEYKGDAPSTFDIRSEFPSNFPLLFTPDPTSPFTYLRSDNVSSIAKGDYVLLMPYDGVDRRAEFQNSAQYELIYRSHSSYLPDMNLKRLLKLGVKSKTEQAHLSGDFTSDTNFYLYKKTAD